MSLVQECQVQSLLLECDQLSERQEREAREAVVRRIDQIYSLFRSNIRDAFQIYSLDVIVRFAEIAVEIPLRASKAAEIIDLFFERVQTTNQFFIRALLVRAKVITYSAHGNGLKGEEMLVSLKESLACISRALDLISPAAEPAAKGKDPKGGAGDAGNKSKYSFLIYNASTTLYKITRFLLRGGWQKWFVEVYERIQRLLQEVDEPDHNWRCRFTLVLYQCLYDSERKPDAFKVLDALWERTKNKPCDFQDALFRLRVYLCKENAALAAVVKKDTEGADPNGWKVLEALQRMRAGMVPEAQVEKELMTIVNQISVGVLSTNETGNSAQLSPTMQERLAEAGRIALRFGLISQGSSIVSFLGKTRQPSQKALVLNEYNKAELLVRRKGELVDKKTGMSMSASQVKQVQIENRKQALKIMEKVMLINKKLDCAELIYEGAVLVWNIALPFLTEQYHTHAARALDLTLALLEQIDTNDHDLRTRFHLQLIQIYFANDLMFAEVESNVFKALRLDPSIPTAKLPNKPQPEEDASLYARPYHRYLLDFRQKVLLKTMQIVNPSPLDAVTTDLWTIEDHKSETTKIDTLQKCLRSLISYEEPPFVVDPEQMLVDEEIKKRRLDYDREKLRNFKRRKLLTAEIAKLSFEWELNDFAKKACEFVLADVWDVKNSMELIIAQGHCCLFMAQIKIDELYQDNAEALFEEESSAEGGEAKAREIKEKKGEVIAFLKRGLDYSLTTQQSYLIFNGAICLWNNFLHIFRVAANDTKLRPDLTPLLKDYFEAMRNSLREIETKNITYYDLDDKIQAFSNIGLVYARLLESQKQTAQVEKVCEDLLLTNLAPNTRKLINGIKARVGGGKAGGAKPADPKKGGVPAAQKVAGFNDTFILEISNQLELIQNSPNKNELESQVVKCFEGLETWKPNEQDESELELHAELWVKLARLAANEDTPKMLKYSLRCAEKALVQSRTADPSAIPSNRLRWYSLAEFLSSESLLKLVNPKTQEAGSVQGLLLLSLARGVQAGSKGFRCGINVLVVDAGKQVWNVCARLQESRANRAKLLQPVRSVLNFLKELKEDSEPDLLLLLGQLYFRAAWESCLYKEGEEVADMLLELLPKGLQKSVWEAKMSFMSKQGKNELQAISSIKEAEPSLQAKLWVKLARIAPNAAKQQAAYSKALQILKKEHSVEIVEVLIEYSEWQLRVAREPLEAVVKNLEYAGNLLVEIEYEQEGEEEEGEDDQTLNSHSRSRSLRSKKSAASKSVKSSQKDIKREKKAPPSGKSKVSRVSRMNRSGRAAKSIKNKNTKSVFSQREEDPAPDCLNCLHFERLFRISTILASVHSAPAARLTHALNARKHVLSMLSRSIQTFNELQENAAKLNEKEERGAFRTASCPASQEEWVTYELPKEYVEKIDKVDSMNFLGSYALERPELTYAYLNKLIGLLSELGLDFHTLPLRFFAKYLTRHILKNELYHTLEELRLKQMLLANRHPLEAHIKLAPEELRVADEDSRQEVLRAEYQKTNASDPSSFDTVSAPNLVHPLSKHDCWFQLGVTLIELGEVAAAKLFLKESLKCAKILGQGELVGRIHGGLSEIAFLEGESQEAVQHLLLAHRLCKWAGSWQRIVQLASRVLGGLRKYDILRNFLKKIHATVGELVEESLKEGKERSGFRIEVAELKQLLVSVETALLHLAFRELVDEDTPDNRAAFALGLQTLEKTLQDKNKVLWNTLNYEQVLRNFSEIIEVYETNGGPALLQLGDDNFNTLFAILRHLERMVKDFISSVALTDSEGAAYNAIGDVQIRIGFSVAACHCLQHRRSQQETSSVSQEQSSEANEQVRRYLQQIDREIRKKAEPVAVRLTHLENALTTLNDLEAHVQEHSHYYPRLLALQLYAHTLLDASASEALEAGEAFRSRGEERLDKFENDAGCHYYQLKAYESLIEQQGAAVGAESFESLSRMQHAQSVSSCLNFLRRKLSPHHKLLAALRLGSNNKELSSQLMQKEKLFAAVTKVPAYADCLKLIPRNSVYIVLQLSKCKTRLYYGCLINETEGRRFISKAVSVGAAELGRLKAMGETLLQCRKSLIKTPIEDDNKLNALLEGNEKQLREVQSQLQTASQWWLNELLEYLRTPKNVPVVSDKDKKGGKDAKKKGGKDEIAGYESPLPPSPCGIESVTFLLDEFLYCLPFEELLPTDLIATVSKDSSLFWLSRKLQEMSFQPELNNSAGYGADKGKYCGYDFKSSELNFKAVAAELAKATDPLKLEGIDSAVRLPSLGDYSRLLLEPGFLQIYGSVDLLAHVRVGSLIEAAGSNKLRLLVIHDNLNWAKGQLIKYRDLSSEQGVSVEESELAVAVVANLLNAAVIRNRWFLPPHPTLAAVKQTYRTLAAGQYIGAAVRSGRREGSLSEQWMSYLHGPAVTRL